jgi:hypothetical protein
MAWVQLISALGSAYSSYENNKAAGKNKNNVNNLQYTPIDLTQLETQATQAAQANIANSIAIEAQNEPGLSATRFGLQGQLSSDLNNGGLVPTDVANQVSRSAITGANSAGLTGAAGPVTAASLGTTSMAIRNANQQKAMQLLQGNQLPTAGLDPGALASASIANTNAGNYFNLAKSGALNNANQSSADAKGGMIGSLFGTGSGSNSGSGNSSGLINSLMNLFKKGNNSGSPGTSGGGNGSGGADSGWGSGGSDSGGDSFDAG